MHQRLGRFSPRLGALVWGVDLRRRFTA